jgi:hypothetical protein
VGGWEMITKEELYDIRIMYGEGHPLVMKLVESFEKRENLFNEAVATDKLTAELLVKGKTVCCIHCLLYISCDLPAKKYAMHNCQHFSDTRSSGK